jgi:RNA polymerase sigma factor (sigma-70 family)
MTDSKQDPPDDATLVMRCKAGDEAAWETLVERYQRLVYAIVRRMDFDEHGCADVFQTVFSRLLEHLPRLTEPDRLQAWIVTTAKREALLQRKRAARHISITPTDEDNDSEFDIQDEALLPEETLEQLQLGNLVRNGLARLDERCRELLTLLYCGDDAVAYEAVAAKLAIPIGSIGPRRARCLEKLRKLVE